MYYSGEGSKSNPEYTLGDRANIMLTFFDMYLKGGPTNRFKEIKQARKRGKQSSSITPVPVESLRDKG